MASSPRVYVFAGPNGAGKTTFATTFLPTVHCHEFVNADLIATGLSPLNPQAAAVTAGRLVLKRMDELIENQETFGFETTLSGKSYVRLFRRLQKKNYQIEVFYLWLPTPNLAVQRVWERVQKGGHNVPEPDVRRRYTRGLKNFFQRYMRLSDSWILVDNSTKYPYLISWGSDGKITLVDRKLYGKIKAKYGKAH